MSGAALATVDLAALRHNLNRARSVARGSRVMAVVKGDAYGHGMLPVARALGDADGLAVARTHEAATLRDAGIEKPILVLEGFHNREELETTVRLGLQAAIHAPHQLRLLESAPTGERRVRVWLKIDTGMHRLGFPAERLPALHGELTANPRVELVCLMTHFASADDPDDPFTELQIRKFRAAVGAFPCDCSMANSAALLGWPESHGEWVRPGIMLYGTSPFRERTAEEDGLVPVMTFTSRLIAINEVEAGGKVGYGGIWTSSGRSRIGVVAAGYGDGYPREAPNGTPLLVAGVRVPLAGRVSMDMLTVDLTAHPDAAVGDEVVMWGEGLPVEEIAGCVETVPYALLCGITRRTHMQYVNGSGADEGR